VNIPHPIKIALGIFLIFIKKTMKKSHRPVTRVKNPEPKTDSPNWVIWAAWADRITFEDIKKKTGKSETEVIKIMRKSLKPSSFKLWRKRAKNQSIKHRKKFELSRKEIRRKLKKNDYI
tara:strand:- start:239 stop:595 length:357 start_codon:yes stop_codon:yes gene_type:complete